MKYSADHQHTLKLTLHKLAFQVMVTGEKPFEFRKPSQWIMSRLKRDIKQVQFTNGYGKDKPVFTAEYKGHTIAQADTKIQYSNYLIVEVKKGDIVIHLGKIISIYNYTDAIPQNTVYEEDIKQYSAR